MKKIIFVLIILTLGLYLFKVNDEADIYARNSEEAYIGKFKSFDKKVCGGYSLNDIEFQNLLTESCKVSSELLLTEYTKKAFNFISEGRYNTTYLSTEAFSPIASTPLKPFQADYENKLLHLLKNPLEQSIIIRNFITLNCENKTLESAWSFMEKNANPFLTYQILSSIKECYFIGWVKKEEFLQRGLSLLQRPLNKDIFLEAFALNISMRGKAPRQITTFLISRKPFLEKLVKNETLMYLDELSQFYYLSENYEESKKTLEEYLKLYTNEFNLEFMTIQKAIALARLGKAYLRLGHLSDALKTFKELGETQDFLKSQSKYYYPDFSLASLLLENNKGLEVKNYLTHLMENGSIERRLTNKWLTEMEQGKIPEFEIEIFKERYDQKKGEVRYETEASQIMLFKESMKNNVK